MMIPTTSIDGVSIPVMRDGANLVSDMPLGAVASQVLEQGAAFEAAVEQFQRAMAEIPVLVKDTSAPLAPTVAQERDLPAALPTGEHLETADRQFPQAGATPVPADVGAAARTIIPQAGTDPVPTDVGVAARTIIPQAGADPVPVDVGTTARTIIPQVGTDPVPADVGPSARTIIPQSGTDPVPADVGVAARTIIPQTGTDPVPADVGTAARTIIPQAGTDPVPADVGTVARTIIPQAGADPVPADVGVAARTIIPQAGATPVPVEVSTAARTIIPQVETAPVDGTKAPVPVAVAVDEPETKVEDRPDVPVLQAAPVAVAPEPQVIDVKNLAVESVQVVSARVAHQVMATPAQVLIEAAAAVADTIVVSPGLLRGTGEVQVQLRPDVLEGTVIHISTVSPGALSVQFTPMTENMAVLLEKCAPQLVTYLSERIHSVQIAVNVKRDDKLKG